MLLEGKDLVTEIPKERFDYTPFFEHGKRLPGKMYSKWGGFIDGADCFDLKLFKMAPIDARFLDPQVRMILMCTWELLEDAGYNRREIQEKHNRQVGVFIGGMQTDYALITANTNSDFIADALSADQANRVSHFFDFEGPSLSINTMCSSSLASIHLARQSLLSNECELAIAGGVNLIVHHQKYLGLCDANLLSTDGLCRSFGLGGNGYVPCEGVGLALLKNLDQAIADGDHIYGVIRGSAINNSGNANAYRVPSPDSQSKVIKKAIHVSGVDPKDLTYIEAHGTGTKLGDPIEIEGLNQAIGVEMGTSTRCPVGSIKSNMGHSESAAGIAALTKVLLQFEHQTLVPSIHTDSLNPDIEFQRSPFYVQRKAEKWKRKTEKLNGRIVQKPLLAGISSFGAGGVNLHLIVEEYLQPKKERVIDPEPQVITLSAMSESQLVQMATHLKEHLKGHPQLLLQDISYTLCVGREDLLYRVAFVSKSVEDLKEKLQKYVDGISASEIQTGKKQGRMHDLEPYDPKDSSLIDVVGIWCEGRKILWGQTFKGKDVVRVRLPKYPFALEKASISPNQMDPHPGVFNRLPPKIQSEPEERFDSISPTEQSRPKEHPIWEDEKADFSKTVLSEPVWTLCEYSKLVRLKEGYQKILICPREWKSGLQDCGADRLYPLDFERSAEAISANLIDFALTLQQLQKSKEVSRATVICVAPQDHMLEISPFVGFFKSLRAENPSFLGKVLLIDHPVPSLIEQEWLTPEPFVKREQERFVQKMVERPLSEGTLPLVKEGGVYWITGGAGGLGKLFANHFNRANVTATLILSGRSALSKEKQKEIEGLESLKLKVEYRQCNVGKEEEAQALVSSIIRDHQRLDGVIHSAGVLRDGLFIKKSRQDFTDVFSPKIFGAWNIKSATAHLSLDYFLLFSSESSLFGNIGQTDYAAANHFLDLFPQFWNRKGICKTINWPLWENGGMQVPDHIIEMIRKETGMVPLSNLVGVQSLQRILNMDANQIFICEGGEVDKIKETFALVESKKERVVSKPPNFSIAKEVKREIARLMEWKEEMIDEEASFQDVGMDSVRLNDLAQKLSEKFSIELAPTIFFEYPILREFIEHLTSEVGETAAADAFDIGNLVRREIARILEWDEAAIDEEGSFQDFGMDSVRLNDFATILSKELKIDLSPTIFFEYPILHEFIDHLKTYEISQVKKLEAEVEQPKADNYRKEVYQKEPIAITGIACRFPMADDLSTFWENLKQGVDGIGPILSSRKELKGLKESDDPALQRGGFLTEVDAFDASFFGLSPKEAELMDPQHRLCLETVWHAIEDAGYSPKDLAGSKTALFFGVSSVDYAEWISRANVSSPYVSTGLGHSSLVNRISFFLDLKGPSEPVNTACSSSLVAIHRAVESIRSGSATGAIIGGVNLILHPHLSVAFRKAGMLSCDSTCKTFDESANGYVRGEGVAALVLKPLSKAKKDGDHIYGLIRGSAVNHGGRANSLSAPNPTAQAEVILEACQAADVRLNTLGYIETHGTGTSLGDPIEMQGLMKAFSNSIKGDVPSASIALGAVKTNIGHLESAAGAAAIIKVLLSLRDKTLVPNLHLKKLNPHIQIDKTPFYFPNGVEQWSVQLDAEGKAFPRRAGVSSFGYGGVNAHVVCEEYIDSKLKKSEKALPVFLLSAKTEKALHELVRSYLSLEKSDFDAMLFTLQQGRSELQHRLAILADNDSQLKERLRRYLENGPDSDGILAGEARNLREKPLDSTNSKEVAKHWIQGRLIDWKAIYKGKEMKRTSLPLYPFEKERFFVGLGEETEEKQTFSFDLSKSAFYFTDHVIAKGKILPGVMYLDLILQAHRKWRGHSNISIEELTWEMPLLATKEIITLNVTFHPDCSIEVWKEGINQQKTLYCQARLGKQAERLSPFELSTALKNKIGEVYPQSIYSEFEDMGFQYGPTFRSIQKIEKGQDELLAHVEIAEEPEQEFILHPSLADGIFQSLIGLETKQKGAAMPLGFDRFTLFESFPQKIKGWAKLHSASSSVDFLITDEKGKVLAQIENFHIESIDPKDRGSSSKEMREKTIEHLRKIISEETKMPMEKVGAKDDFELFGIDSFMGIALTEQLEKVYGALSKTIFYECQNIEELADELVGHSQQEHVDVQNHLPKAVDQRGIAIVGIAGHYPGANGLDELWEILEQGKNSITEIPKDRWDHSQYYDPHEKQAGKTYGKWGGFIDDVDKFDPRFFNISHGEAQFMDPQERLMLQTTWEALENAGYSPRQFSPLHQKQVGVFMGLGYWDYHLYAAEETAKGNTQQAAANMAGVANRVSFFFNCSGPSLVIDTMCSSSLTALHLACESLLRGEVQAALVGGINLNLHPSKFLILGQAQFLSHDGVCRTMGEQGDGFVPSEGVGCVVLKPLKKAIEDSDQILGVIKGTAINHGSKVKGYTVPNPKAQAHVIEKAMEKADISPEEIQYVELHGTGTQLGDPIEMKGLTSAYGGSDLNCKIGSVKSNIGHCEAAAGIAGLTKILLQMQKEELVPSIHAETLNSAIDWDSIPFSLQTKKESWHPNSRGKRVAALSSFGAGGSNAHVILEDYPKPQSCDEEPRVHEMVLSAKDPQCLQQLADQLLSFLQRKGKRSDVESIIADLTSIDREKIDPSATLVDLGLEVGDLITLQEQLGLKLGELRGDETVESLKTSPPLQLGDIAHTLRSGRELMKEYVVFTVETMEELLLELENVSRGEKVRNSIDVGELTESDPRKRKRIPLPTYPFRKERLWIETQKDEKKEIASSQGIDQLKNALHLLANIPFEQMKLETTFEEIGLDSVLIRKLTGELKKTYEGIDTTAFFAHKTLGEFANFLDGRDKTAISLSSGVKAQEIAIVGMSGRLPKAENLEHFFENLAKRLDCIIEIPKERFDYHPHFSKQKQEFGKLYCKWGGFIEGVEEFDPFFFKISPDEARYMDPQERIFLEEAWKCVESSGYCPKNMTRSVGVFAGATFNNYQLVGADAFGKLGGYPANSQTFSIANRVSYIMDFHGPSLTLDTACSSSLYAIHLACESIRRGECEMALAGGVNLSLHPSKYISLSMSGFAASDGKCHAFTDGGDGYVPGEGVGVVLLKPLEHALKEGDQIYGVIKGSGVSHDGRTHGYTVPNPVSQSIAIKKAIEMAKVSPETISYVEAHGTGTPLGDPIEIQGLKEVYGKYTSQKQFCSIGSVKTNIGHLEAAAGIAQLFKVVGQFKNEKIYSTLKHGKVNSELQMEITPFQIAFEQRDWIAKEGAPRRAAISSFGAGGVNVHMILEEAPKISRDEPKASEEIFLVSARTDEQLLQLRRALANYLENQPSICLADVAYTLSTGRQQMDKSFVCRATTVQQLTDKLRNGTSEQDISPAGYEGRNCCRVWLPTYPFSKKRYSITDWSREVEEEKKEEQAIDFGDMSEVELQEWLIEMLIQLVSEILGFEKEETVNVNLGFFEMGMESIQGLKLQQGIQTIAKIRVNDTAIFDYPTISALATHLFEQIKPDTSNPIDEMDEEELAFALEQELASLNLKD